MGIRFRCHHCEHELHVKDFQGGKRGRCPECQESFRIPAQTADHSLPLADRVAANTAGAVAAPERRASESRSAFNSASTTPSSPRSTSSSNATNSAASKSRRSSSGAASSGSAQSASRSTSKSSKNKSEQRGSTSEKVSGARETADAMASEQLVDERSSAAETESIAAAEAVQRLPRAIVDYPNSIWHVRPASGGQYGPANSDTFGEWLLEGRIDPDGWVWRDDWDDWQQVAEVFSDFYPKSVPPPPSIKMDTEPSGRSTGPIPVTTGSPVSPVGTQTVVASAANPRREKRLRQQKRNMLLIALLVVVFIGLVITLTIVLLTQGSGS